MSDSKKEKVNKINSQHKEFKYDVLDGYSKGSPICYLCDSSINPDPNSLWHPCGPVLNSSIRYPCYTNTEIIICESCYEDPDDRLNE